MKKRISSTQALVIKPKFRINWDIYEPALRFSILAAGLIILVMAMQKDLLFSWSQSYLNIRGDRVLRYLLFFSAVIFVFSLIFRTYLWFRYKPFPSADINQWPGLTVVVPAYNEGQNIYKTIVSIAECDYPEDYLKIIAIDDGSRDDTYSYMESARTRYPEKVELIRFKNNRGKRKAIFAAYQKSASPFLITIDSDTLLQAGSIKEIVTPMITNSTIGAVVGRIKVLNSNQNLLTKMMNAHFAMAFDFTRAVQSTFLNVFCLAGAFAAYRKSVLDQVVTRWLDQKFLGQPCTYGEDRSLTNYILKTGYGTFFQRNAVAFTIVPTTLVKILKTLTRWARSNIRESIIYPKILMNRAMKGKRTLPFIEYFSTYSLMILHMICFYIFLFNGLVNSHFILRFLAYSILFGFFYSLYYLKIEGKKDFPYLIAFSVFCSIFMVFIFTVASFTLTKKSWATR